MSTYVPAKYRILRAFANSEKAMVEAVCAYIQENVTRDFQIKLISHADQDIQKIECKLYPGEELFLVIDSTASQTISGEANDTIIDFIAGWEAAKANITEK